MLASVTDVCLYANIRIFKQITTLVHLLMLMIEMFVSMQIYEFLSKSQRFGIGKIRRRDVCLYANIRIFKQITTLTDADSQTVQMFVSMQIYEFLSKSQQADTVSVRIKDVCLYANIRIFKQITTIRCNACALVLMFVSMQIYEFLSKSQRMNAKLLTPEDVCLYANIRIFKQITTLTVMPNAIRRCLSLCKYTNF